ncbi:hypothetical protein BDC45DRAFT_539024 [Circinella umbellata]|nr:hypothetical protein BDC45DRAFT_539024 [Circinella umbellata]
MNISSKLNVSVLFYHLHLRLFFTSYVVLIAFHQTNQDKNRAIQLYINDLNGIRTRDLLALAPSLVVAHSSLRRGTRPQLTRCVVVSFGQTKEKVHVIRDLELDPWVVM